MSRIRPRIILITPSIAEIMSSRYPRFSPIDRPNRAHPPISEHQKIVCP